jgi:hypothetical protein
MTWINARSFISTNFTTTQQHEQRVVLPFEMVENSSILCKPISDRFFHQGVVQTGHLILEKGSIRGLLLAPSSTCQRDAPAPPSGLRATQAQTGSKG